MTSARFGVAASIERLVGRQNLVRGSRFLLDYARRDLPNRMESNGELLVQDTVLGTTPDAGSITVLDVGANIGDWSQRILRSARARDRVARVHAFEPAAETFAALERNLLPEFEGRFVPVHAAASDHNGSGILYKVHELAGSNSIHGVAGDTTGMVSEVVELRTLDDYCASAGLDVLDLVKIDAEGHDHLVLTGAAGLLERQAIGVVQFEYNHRWIGARRYLKDVFDDLEPMGYRIGKVTGRGIEWYPGWSEELETFREGNYLAVLPEWGDRFPSLDWWRRPPPSVTA